MQAPNPGWTRAPWAGVPQPPTGSGGQSPAGAGGVDVDENSTWESFFHSTRDIVVGSDTFRVYLAGEWSSAAPLLLFLHGAGYNALTWCCLVQQLLRQCDCRVAALVRTLPRHVLRGFSPHALTRVSAQDLRGHGATLTQDDTDFSIERLVTDVVAVCDVIVPPDSPLVLVGHSMGGAVASKAAAQLGDKLRGIVVVDCVETAALDACPQMEVTVRARPHAFASARDALNWWVRSGASRSPAAARLSLLGQLRDDYGQLVWRTDVALTIPHWRGWFSGQRDAFLSSTVPKLLLLSEARVLDAPLQVAHMQGRFQLVVLPQAGHAIHEDAPGQASHAVAEFIRRFVRSEGKLPAVRDDHFC